MSSVALSAFASLGRQCLVPRPSVGRLAAPAGVARRRLRTRRSAALPPPPPPAQPCRLGGQYAATVAATMGVVSEPLQVFHGTNTQFHSRKASIFIQITRSFSNLCF